MLGELLLCVGVILVLYSLFHLRGRVSAEIAVESEDIGWVGPVDIVYATQTGKSEELAKRLARDGKDQRIWCRVSNIAEWSVERLKSENTILFVVATHYEGLPPDDMAPLWKSLQKEKGGDWNQLRYSGFAVGDINYREFCKAGRDLDKKLGDLGSQRLFPWGEGSNHEGRAGDNMEEWALGMWTQLRPMLQPTQPEPNWSVCQVADNIKSTAQLEADSKKLLESPLVIVKEVRELRQAPSGVNSTLHVEMSLPSGVTYRTGQNLKFYPQNSPESISQVLECLSLQPSDLLHISRPNSNLLPFPSPISAQELLTHFLDLQGTLTRAHIKNLLQVVKTASIVSE